MNTPESSSGLRIARFWKTNASISMPTPAIAQAISDPRMPVATPNRAGREKTPAPTMLPTTIPVSVGRVILATPLDVVWVSVAMPPPPVSKVAGGRPCRCGEPDESVEHGEYKTVRSRYRVGRDRASRWSARVVEGAHDPEQVTAVVEVDREEVGQQPA